jgi:hypothetical protein
MRLMTLAGSIVALIAVTMTLPAQAKPADLKTQKIDGRQMTGTLVRYQQAYYLENSAFAKTIADLGPLDQFKAAHYRYQMTQFTQVKQRTVMIVGRPTKPGLPTYLGLVRIMDMGNQSMTTIARICESTRATAVSVTQRSVPVPNADGSSICPTGFTEVNN